MTEKLQSAIERVRQLPEKRQDMIAAMVLDEIDSENLWDQRFMDTADELEAAAQAALERDQRGEAIEKGWDAL